MGPVGLEVKEFILREFLEGEDPGELTEKTPLLNSGILDSLATLKLARFLEEQFAIQLEPHELDEEHIGSIEAIENAVLARR